MKIVCLQKQIKDKTFIQQKPFSFIENGFCCFFNDKTSKLNCLNTVD